MFLKLGNDYIATAHILRILILPETSSPVFSEDDPSLEIGTDVIPERISIYVQWQANAHTFSAPQDVAKIKIFLADID